MFAHSTPTGASLPASLDSLRPARNFGEQFPAASSALIARGLATLIDGRLSISDAGIDRYAQLLQASRAHGSNRKNAAWTGKLIFDLAHLVSQSLDTHGELSHHKALYRTFFRMGHRISPGQFNYGLGIFAPCTSALEVHARLEAHRSHGAWWASLTPEERQRHIEARQEAQRRFWDRLSPEERSARRQVAQDALQAAAIAVCGDKEGQRVANASELSLALKALERGLTPGSSIRFGGISEPMRSSWEALFARVIGRCKDRFYIYEPMGFPLIDPATGKVETYHPDFLDYKTRKGQNCVRVIEIKGLLTPTGRRKINLFRKFYLEGDFSSVPEARRPLLLHLVEAAKKQAREQFQLDLGRNTPFRVFGELYWRDADTNFVVRNSSEAAHDLTGRGLIPRLMKRFPELVPTERAPSFSRNELRKHLGPLMLGSDTLSSVQPIQKVKVERSLDVPLTSYTMTRLYALIHIVHESMQACVAEGLVVMPDSNPLITAHNMGAIQDLVTTWHAANEAQRKTCMQRLDSRRKKPSDHITVYFEIVYLELVQSTLFPDTMFKFQESLAHEGPLFERLRRNAGELLARMSPLEQLADKKLKRVGADNASLSQLKAAAAKHAGALASSFAERYESGKIPLDLVFISEQYRELLEMGLSSVVYIHPQPGSLSVGEDFLRNRGLITPDETPQTTHPRLKAYSDKYGPKRSGTTSGKTVLMPSLLDAHFLTEKP